MKRKKKRQLDEQIKKEEEAIFQEMANQAQREAEAEADSQYGFNPDEVDFGDDQDEEMEVSEKGGDDAAMEVDEKDDEERADAGKTNLKKSRMGTQFGYFLQKDSHFGTHQS